MRLFFCVISSIFMYAYASTSQQKPIIRCVLCPTTTCRILHYTRQLNQLTSKLANISLENAPHTHRTPARILLYTPLGYVQHWPQSAADVYGNFVGKFGADDHLAVGGNGRQILLHRLLCKYGINEYERYN